MATQPIIEEQRTDPPANDPEAGDQGGTEQQEAPRDYEAEARQRGWVPKEEFLAKPNAKEERWVDAETFIERTDTVMPLLKADRDRLKRELSDVKRQMKQVFKYATAAEDRIRAELQTKMEEAVEAGDVEGFRKLQKESGDLQSGDSATPKHSKDEALEAFDDFRDENNWYDRGALAGASEAEKDARVYADRLMERRLRAIKPGEEPPPDELFSTVAADVRAKFPELGQNGVRQPRQKPQSDVAAPGTGRAPRGGRTYDALTAEARATFDKWMRTGELNKGSAEKTKAYFASTFDWAGWEKENAR